MMKTSETIKELAAALSNAQSQLESVQKSASGYGYNYAPLDLIIEQSRSVLTDNGLSFIQMPSTPPVEYYPALSLTARILHSSGEWIEDTMVMPLVSGKNMNDAQGYGAALTYARRYQFSSMFGIVTDEDTDGNVPKQKSSAKKSKPMPKQSNSSDDFKKWYYTLPSGAKAAYEATSASDMLAALSYIERYADNPHSAKNALAKFASIEAIDYKPERDVGKIRVLYWNRVNAYAQMRNAGMERGKAASGAMSQVKSV